MPIRYEVPKLLNLSDIFMWWCRNKIRERRHLQMFYATSHSKPTMLVSRNKDEVEWIGKHLKVLAEQISDMEEIDKHKNYFTSTTKLIYKLKQELYEYKDKLKQLKLKDQDEVVKIIDAKLFNSIIYEFNARARKAIIYDGGILGLGNNLGYIYPAVIERAVSPESKSTRMPNWGASKARKKELLDKGIAIKSKENPDGAKWIIYFDDEYYLRIAWAKRFGASHVKRIKFYKFEPSRGPSGFKKEFATANQSNPLLKKRYFIPKVKNAYYSKKANKGSHEHIEVHVGKRDNR